MTYSPVVLALREARALVAKGWCQYHYRIESGKHCAVGAVNKAYGDELSVRSAAFEALSLATGGIGIVEWNDAPGRTQLEVLEAFNHAIAIAAGEGT